MFISTICVTLSGYILISSNFQSQMNSEIKTAQDYGEIVYYSLANEFEDSSLSSAGESVDTAKDAILQIAHSINISSMNEKIAFGIIDPEGNTLFSSLNAALDKTIIGSINKQSIYSGHAASHLLGRSFLY